MRTQLISSGQKSLLQLLGLLMFLGGLGLGLVTAVAVLISSFSPYNDGAVGTALSLETATLLAFGGGIVFFTHAGRSLSGKPSRKLRLASLARLGGLFILLLLAGVFVSALRFAPVYFLPPILLGAAGLPPLYGVAWFMQAKPGRLTWRRGAVAFVLGGTVSVLLAIVLELILPGIFVLFLSSVTNVFARTLQAFLDLLGAGQIASALTSPGFVLLFVQLAVIAPVAEEICKPLVTLPVLRYLDRRGAFFVGALAGAGFAAVENIIYLVSGFAAWPGLLMVRALGAAIHPLGAGLVASGWHGVLRGERGSVAAWLARFGAAVALHGIWNGGILVLLTLTGVPVFGRTPRLDLFGVSSPGLVLAFLLVVGLAALWLGRDAARSDVWGAPSPSPAARWTFEFAVSDRAIAIWALACAAVAVPAGIAALSVLGR